MNVFNVIVFFNNHDRLTSEKKYNIINHLIYVKYLIEWMAILNRKSVFMRSNKPEKTILKF
jgi:hypothetical protein